MSQQSPSPTQVERLEYITLWRLGGLTIQQLVVQSFAGFRRHQLDARSAQFAFYAIMALAPLLIVIIASVAQLPLEGVLESFLQAIDVGMPENVVELIRDQVRDIQEKSQLGLILVAFILLGIAGSRVFLTIGAGLDIVYGVQENRLFWKASGIALLLTVGVFLLLLTSMVMLVIGPAIAEFFIQHIQAQWVHILMSRGLRWTVACLFMLLSTSTIYCLVPSLKLPWYWLSPGSVFATVGWVVVTQGFRIYVENFSRYNETYGALGGVVVLMIWLYMTGALMLLGGQINGLIHLAEKQQDKTEKVL